MKTLEEMIDSLGTRFQGLSKQGEKWAAGASIDPKSPFSIENGTMVFGNTHKEALELLIETLKKYDDMQTL